MEGCDESIDAVQRGRAEVDDQGLRASRGGCRRTEVLAPGHAAGDNQAARGIPQTIAIGVYRAGIPVDAIAKAHQEAVIAATAGNHVVAAAAFDGVVAGISQQRVVSAATTQVIADGQAVVVLLVVELQLRGVAAGGPVVNRAETGGVDAFHGRHSDAAGRAGIVRGVLRRRCGAAIVLEAIAGSQVDTIGRIGGQFGHCIGRGSCLTGEHGARQTAGREVCDPQRIALRLEARAAVRLVVGTCGIAAGLAGVAVARDGAVVGLKDDVVVTVSTNKIVLAVEDQTLCAGSEIQATFGVKQVGVVLVGDQEAQIATHQQIVAILAVDLVVVITADEGVRCLRAVDDQLCGGAAAIVLCASHVAVSVAVIRTRADRSGN